MILVKVHLVERQGYSEVIVAVCDKNLVGKTFDDFFISPRFYGGDEAEDSVVLNVVSKATLLNIVGEKSVSLLIKNGFIKKENVKEISGVPHAQVFVLEK